MALEGISSIQMRMAEIQSRMVALGLAAPASTRQAAPSQSAPTVDPFESELANALGRSGGNRRLPGTAYVAAPPVASGQPPNRRQWAEAVLRRLAEKTGQPPDRVVTTAHVEALVTWAVEEGGGVDTHLGNWNPLNTKKLDPDLGGTKSGRKAGESFATVDYPNFEQGVEAAVRTIMGKYQNRMATVLTDPSTSAEDVISALGHPERFPGNKGWAEPGDTYESELLSVLGKVRANPGKFGEKQLRG